jgi:hypothetical protein
MDFKLWLERKFMELPTEVNDAIDRWISNVLPNQKLGSTSKIRFGDNVIPTTWQQGLPLSHRERPKPAHSYQSC